MHKALRDALAEAEADETCRALLLTGAGRGFCAGQDLNDRLSKAGETPVLGGALEAYYNPLVRKLRGAAVPGGRGGQRRRRRRRLQHRARLRHRAGRALGDASCSRSPRSGSSPIPAAPGSCRA